MDNVTITVEQTQGGIGSDAWTAFVRFVGASRSLDVRARGESRQHARANLSYELAAMLRELAAIHKELSS